MNTLQIGRDFESEAYNYLKEKFDSVEWNKNRATYDFTAIKKGKKYNIEAKIRKDNFLPQLNYNQKDADFLITKRKGKIKLFNKNFIKKNISVLKMYKTIKVSKEIKKEMESIKIIPEESMEHLVKRLVEALKNNEHNR